MKTVDPIFYKDGQRYRLKSAEEMADGKTKQAVYNQQRRGRLPDGVLLLRIGKTNVYAVPENT